MQCPACGVDQSRGISTKKTIPLADEIIRVRRCRACGYSWETVERFHGPSALYKQLAGKDLVNIDQE